MSWLRPGTAVRLTAGYRRPAMGTELDVDLLVVGAGPAGVAASVGLHDLHLVALAEGAMHDDGVACRHRRREGIHHEHDPQEAER